MYIYLREHYPLFSNYVYSKQDSCWLQEQNSLLRGHYALQYLGVCNVMCTIQHTTKAKTKKKSFLWTQNVYVIFTYIPWLWCRCRCFMSWAFRKTHHLGKVHCFENTLTRNFAKIWESTYNSYPTFGNPTFDGTVNPIYHTTLTLRPYKSMNINSLLHCISI
jgi:hypothetical protein